MIEKQEIEYSSRGLYLTVLLYPLWALYISFRHFRTPQAKNLFWLFCVFLGMIHIYLPEGGSDADGTRYAEKLIELNQQPVTWDNFTSSFYEDGQFIDIYQPVITYILALLTDNPQWLFIIFAIVFGFFYSRNIWFVLEKFSKDVGVSLFILTLYYMLICPIWEINGVRMWTALHVFVYGALHYLYNSDNKKLIWCFVSLLIHFSFIIPVTILLIYRYIPKSINFLLTFFIISLFMAELNLEQIRDFLLPYTPSFLTVKVESYTSEATIQNVIDAKSNLNFYVEGSKIIVRCINAFLLSVSCVFGRKIIKNNKRLLNLLCFSLFIYSISNILSSVPSLGRFITLSQMFAFASIIFFYIYYKQSEGEQKIITMSFKSITILLLFPIVYIIRVGCDYYGISVFFNPIAAIFIEDNQPIIQLIKSIFVI